MLHMKLITKIKYIIAGIAIFIIATITFAIENEYKNNLLNITLKTLGDSNVEVMLFMQKPFHEPVSVIKKSDFEYVIMLADTYHSITSKPSITSAAPLVTNVDIKLFPYLSTANNGYTKITVLTSSKANITAKTFVSNVSSSKSNDLTSEIEALIAKKPEPKQVPKTANKPVENKKRQATTPKSSEPVKPLIKYVDKELKEQKFKQQPTEQKKVETPKAEPKKEDIKAETPPTPPSATVEPQKIKTPPVSEPIKAMKLPQKQNNYKDILPVLFVSACIPLFIIAYFMVRIRNRKQNKNEKNEQTYQAPISNLSKTEILKEPESELKIDFYKDVKEVDFVEQKPKSLFDEYIKEEDVKEEVQAKTSYIETDIDDFEGLERLEDLGSQNDSDDEILDEKIHYKVIDNPDEPEILDIFTVSDTSGFYLTRFENKISLVGYIYDEITILQTFENFTNPKLVVKLDSETDSSKKFLVKIGKKKFIYEVSPYEMKLLIEL